MTIETETKPQLIPGYETKQFMNDQEKLREWRWARPLKYCQWLKEDMAKRVEESRKLFKWKFFRGDCHSHTHHSDGIGTVAETAAEVKLAGLDFQFVTDHWGVTQGPECRELGLWVGQEPVTALHHMGILGLDHAFVPEKKFPDDILAAKALGATVFVPHPTGWWPITVYEQAALTALDTLPDPFLMEICNGANNTVSAFDYTDESAIELWDHLLMQGKVVHAMGNTDAHSPHAIGIVWNNVYSDTCDQPAILAALNAGHMCVSDGPLLHIRLGQAVMGDRASADDRRDKLAITAVDSRGLLSVRLIIDGKEAGSWACKGKTKFTKRLPIPETAGKYVRVEVLSKDARRAYSNPIYFNAQAAAAPVAD
jgi:hypothetical protein